MTLPALEPQASFHRAGLASRLISQLLAAGMLLCVAVAGLQVVARVAPDWDSRPLGVLGALVVIEALVAERIIRSYAWRGLNQWAYRAAEAFVLLLVFKLGLSLPRGLVSLGSEAAQWWSNPAAFFTGDLLWGGLFGLLLWTLTSWLAAALAEVEEEAEWLATEPEPWRLSQGDPRRQLRGLVFGVGSFLLILAAIVRVDLRGVGGPPPLASASLLNVLVYFILGVLLLSQSQFALQRGAWGRGRFTLQPGLAWRWAGYTGLLLGVTAALASRLPTSYALSPLEAAGALLNQLLLVLQLLIYAALFLPVWLLSALFRFFNPQSAAPQFKPPVFTPPAEGPVAALPWLEAARSLMFWVILMGALLFVLLYYVRPQWEAARELRLSPRWAWLARVWRWLRGGWQAARDVAQQALRAGARWRRTVAPLASPWRYLNVRRLTERDQVRFFYQAFLRRAREAGWPRRPAQTPQEYAEQLRAAWPEDAEALAELTRAFEAAQYSQETISRARAASARRVWETLRRSLSVRRGRTP